MGLLSDVALREIGRTYNAGRITAILPASGSNRGFRAEVVCAHCGKTFVTRLAYIQSGAAGSCGCKKIAAFKKFWGRQLSKVSDKLKRELYEYHELHGRAATAAKFGVSPYLAGTAWIAGRQQLRNSHSSAKLMRIARRFQRMTNAEGKSFFGLSSVDLLAICRIVRSIFRTKDALPAFSSCPVAERIRHCLAVFAEGDGESMPKGTLGRRGDYNWIVDDVREMPVAERDIYRPYGADILVEIANEVKRPRRRRSWWSRALAGYKEYVASLAVCPEPCIA